MERKKDNALLNACVLGRVFEFADVESLKTSRLVCHTWNTIAGCALRKRTIVYFRHSFRGSMHTREYRTNSIGVTSYTRMYDSKEEIESFNKIMATAIDENSKKVKNLNISLFDDATWDLARNTIISEARSSIQSLVLMIFPDFTYDESFASLLLSLPALEHLEIFEHEHVKHFRRDIFQVRQFPKLKSCSVRWGIPFYGTADVWSDETETEKKQLLLDLLKSCSTTLKKLQLKELPKNYYEPIFKETDLKGLTHLSLGWKHRPSQIPVDLLKSLPSQCPNLMDVEYRFEKNVFYLDVLENVFTKMKNLQTINIRRQYDSYSVWRPENAGIVIPKFTTLPIFPTANSVSLNIPFYGDVGILADCLPQVKKLKVNLMSTKEQIWKPMLYLEEMEIWECSRDDGANIGCLYSGLTGESFPNLTKLSAKLGPGCTKPIFKNLLHLKVLIIPFGSRITDEDITGIRTEDLPMADEGNIVRSGPYIGDLKNLQYFHHGCNAITTDSITYGVADLDFLRRLVMILGHGRRYLGPDVVVDFQPLMLPKVKYLTHMYLLIEIFDTEGPMDCTQLEKMKRDRPGFSYFVDYGLISIEDF